jgi:hypothetical protein
MKIKIGGRTLIASASLHIMEDEDVAIEFLADKHNVKVNLKFIRDKNNKYQTIAYEPKDGYAQLIAANWNSPMPSGTPDPIPIVIINGKTVVCTLSGYSSGKFKQFDISFFWGNDGGN